MQFRNLKTTTCPTCGCDTVVAEAVEVELYAPVERRNAELERLDKKKRSIEEQIHKLRYETPISSIHE